MSALEKASNFCQEQTLAKDSMGINAQTGLPVFASVQYIQYTVYIYIECVSLNSRLQLSSQTVPVSPERPSGPQRICPVRPLSASFSSGGPSAPPPAATGETVSPVLYLVYFCPCYCHRLPDGVKMYCIVFYFSLICSIQSVLFSSILFYSIQIIE